MNKQLNCIFIIVILLIFCTNDLFAQPSLSKNEIYTFWVKMHSENDKGDYYKRFAAYDESLNQKVTIVIEEIKKNNIDTLIGLVNSYSGLIDTDSCRAGLYPSDVYLFWVKSNRFFSKRITNNCVFEALEFGSFPAIFYYFQNAATIRNEYILPVIFSARNEGGKVKLSGASVNHEKRYSFFLILDNEHKAVDFSESDISSKESLFYEDNRSTSLYKLFCLMEEKIHEIYASSSEE